MEEIQNIYEIKDLSGYLMNNTRFPNLVGGLPGLMFKKDILDDFKSLESSAREKIKQIGDLEVQEALSKMNLYFSLSPEQAQYKVKELDTDAQTIIYLELEHKE